MKPHGSLLGLSGEYKGETIDIPAGEEINIGRGASMAQIVMGDDSGIVSRRHCGVRYNPSDETYSITDYSKNGIFREDGSRLPPDVQVTLPRGTVIILGSRQTASFRLG